MSAAARAAIVVRCPRGIDARGLHVTNLEALRSALECVASEDTLCLVDGFRVPQLAYEQRRLNEARDAARKRATE